MMTDLWLDFLVLTFHNFFWLWLIIVVVLLMQTPAEYFVSFVLLLFMPITLPVAFIVSLLTNDEYCVLVVAAPLFLLTYYIYNILKTIVLMPVTLGEHIYKLSLNIYLKKIQELRE